MLVLLPNDPAATVDFECDVDAAPARLGSAPLRASPIPAWACASCPRARASAGEEAMAMSSACDSVRASGVGLGAGVAGGGLEANEAWAIANEASAAAAAARRGVIRSPYTRADGFRAVILID